MKSETEPRKQILTLQDYLDELSRLGITPRECKVVPWYMGKRIEVINCDYPTF